ncbi:MAG: alpha/beta fold hydrolase [Elusimicrobia bacterium]|nr:alpha/beta fold hydrolase [Elusimicrobiota bacterium]
MKLALRESGDARRPAVVLLHAFPLSGAMWEPQAAALRDFRVLAPDLRGFGGTPFSGSWLIEHAVDDLFETLDAAGVEKAVLAGLSMGGYVALRAAEKRPERVRALVLCDTRAEADSNEGKAQRAAAIDSVRARGVAAFAEPFLAGALAPETLAGNPRAVGFLKALIGAALPEAVAAALAALAARPDMTGSLSRITVPTAVLVGAQDLLTPLPAAELLRARIAGARLHVIPGAGHLSSVENPAVFNERLVSFLNGLRDRP